MVTPVPVVPTFTQETPLVVRYTRYPDAPATSPQVRLIWYGLAVTADSPAGEFRDVAPVADTVPSPLLPPGGAGAPSVPWTAYCPTLPYRPSLLVTMIRYVPADGRVAVMLAEKSVEDGPAEAITVEPFASRSTILGARLLTPALTETVKLDHSRAGSELEVVLIGRVDDQPGGAQLGPALDGRVQAAEAAVVFAGSAR